MSDLWNAGLLLTIFLRTMLLGFGVAFIALSASSEIPAWGFPLGGILLGWFVATLPR